MSQPQQPQWDDIQILLVVLIFSYGVTHEFIGVLGAEKVRQVFFGPLFKP